MKTRILLRTTLTLVLGLLVTATIASGQGTPGAAKAPQTPPQAGYLAPQYVDAQDVAVAPRLEGSWEITVMIGGEPVGVNLATFTSGGGIINSTPDPNSSTGHGTWVRTGGHQFAITFVAFLSDQGVPVGTEKVRAVVQLHAPTTFSGSFRTDVIIDGKVVQSFCGTVQATRINVDPLEPCP